MIKKEKSERLGRVPTEMQLILEHAQQVILQRVLRIILVILPEHPSDTYVFTMKMEILLESTSNKLMVGYEMGLVMNFEMITLSVGHKNDFVSDLLIDFQIKFSLSIGEIVTHWFTLIVLSALRRSGNENMLGLVILILSGLGGGCMVSSGSFALSVCHRPSFWPWLVVSTDTVLVVEGGWSSLPWLVLVLLPSFGIREEFLSWLSLL
nr:hypothetical protein [Tanacetum cinerariifolium]